MWITNILVEFFFFFWREGEGFWEGTLLGFHAEKTRILLVTFWAVGHFWGSSLSLVARTFSGFNKLPFFRPPSPLLIFPDYLVG